MAGVDLAYPRDVTAVDAPMERLETLLSRHHIRVAVGRSRCTGQTVIRLVDDRTGLPQVKAAGSFSEILTGVLDELAAGDHSRK